MSVATASQPSSHTIPKIMVTKPPTTPSPDYAAPNKQSAERPRVKKHKHYYRPDGNVVILVEKTLFKVDLSVLQTHSPVIRNFVPLIKAGGLPFAGFNDKWPLVLREVSVVEFVRLLAVLYPSGAGAVTPPTTVDEFISVLKLATSLQMDEVRKHAMNELNQLPIDPIRKIAIWDEFHLDPDLLHSAYATLCQRSEPLTMTMTMALGIKNFTKLAAARDYYRQRVGCSDCRKSLSFAESQAIAEQIVSVVFGKRNTLPEKSCCNSE